MAPPRKPGDPTKRRVGKPAIKTLSDEQTRKSRDAKLDAKAARQENLSFKERHERILAKTRAAIAPDVATKGGGLKKGKIVKRYTKAYGRALSEEAQRITKNAAVRKRMREVTRGKKWNFATVRRVSADSAPTRQRKGDLKLEPGLKKARLPKERPFHVLRELTNTGGVSPKGAEWLFDEVRARTPNKTTHSFRSLKIPFAALALLALNTRLKKLKETNPERYKKEHKLSELAVAGIGAYTGFAALKSVRDWVKSAKGLLH